MALNLRKMLKDFVEKYGFGVCTYIADRIGLRLSNVRLYFIYLSFATLGSPILFYLIAAFLLNIRKYLRKRIWNI